MTYAACIASASWYTMNTVKKREDDYVHSWPDDLFDFAWLPKREGQLRKIAEQAEPKEWQYKLTPQEYEFPILCN